MALKFKEKKFCIAKCKQTFTYFREIIIWIFVKKIRQIELIAALFLKCKQTYTDFYRKNPNSWRRNSKTLKVENKRCRDASQTSILANGVQKAENKRNLQVIIIMAKQTIFTSPFIVLLLQQCKIQITIRHRPSWQKSKIFKRVKCLPRIFAKMRFFFFKLFEYEARGCDI